MKILKDEEYNSLKSASGNYSAVVAAMVAAGAKADEITPESILQAMEPKDVTQVDETAVNALNQQITDLTSELDALKTRAENAETRVKQLESAAGEEAVGNKKPIFDPNAAVTIDEVNNKIKATTDLATQIEEARKIL